MKRLTAPLAIAASLAACGHPSKPAPTAGAETGSAVTAPADGSAATPAPTGPAPTTITLAEAGLEADSLDRTADPCADFYQFACGGWLKKNEIPSERARWGRFSEIDERNIATLHGILEEARSLKGADPIMTKLGAFYGACMDEKAVEKQGLTGIKPLQDAIAKAKDAKGVAAAITAIQGAGIPVAFGHGVLPDLKDSTTNALWLDSDGLGLPDRDYYVEDAFKAQRTAYHDHLVRLFKLLGKADKAAGAAADDVMTIETELAKVTRTQVERRDIPNNYHPITVADLAKSAPTYDWAAMIKAVGADSLTSVVVTNPDYFVAVGTLITAQKPAVWQDYLTARVVDGVSDTLPKRFADEHFALEKALTGVATQKDRWKRCVEATGGDGRTKAGAMPEFLGQPFVAKVFPGDSKKFANDLYAAIAVEMGKDIDSLDWMSPATKAAAHKKLAKVQFMTGYPDKWKGYDFVVKPDAFTANALAAQAFEDHRQSAKAGKPYDRSEWLMPTYIVNAYYNPSANNTALPAGILQPPFFGASRSIPANFGAIGWVAGHELTHGFDDQGAQFDEEGRLSNWWQPADLEKFKAKGQCVAKQYSTFEPMPGKFVKGELTLGENIADLGGVKNAFAAYRAQRAHAEQAYVADGFTEDQQFFLGSAQAWCNKDRPEETEKRLTVDPHSPPRFRVFGALRNTPEFAQAFKCALGTPMHPKDTCSVW